MQGWLADQVRTHPRELPLGQLWKFFVQDKRDSAVQDAVADEFKALIVWRAETSMRQRLAQQTRFAKGMAEGRFETQLSVTCSRRIEVKQQAHIACDGNLALVCHREADTPVVFANVELLTFDWQVVNNCAAIK